MKIKKRTARASLNAVCILVNFFHSSRRFNHRFKIPKLIPRVNVDEKEIHKIEYPMSLVQACI